MNNTTSMNPDDTQEFALNAELLELESQLMELSPMPLSELQLNELSSLAEDACNEGVYIDDIEALEKDLGLSAAAALPEDMLLRMSQAMDRWHEDLPVEEKLVAFANTQPTYQSEQEAEKPVRKTHWKHYSAAAAVAILGALSAFITPSSSDSASGTPTFASSGALPIETQTISTPRDAWLVPDSFSHNIVNTSDNGVVMAENNKPHRSIKIEYIDKIVVIDDHGRMTEVERPGVKMVLLPLETN